MGASERNELRNLVRARANALQREAIRSGGSIPPEQLEDLRRLAGLAGIYDAALPVPPRRRWPLIVLFAFTLVIVTILLFVRRRSTEIELDLHVTELGFVLPERQLLSEPLRLSALGVSGLREIQLPRGRSSEAMTLTSGHEFESGMNLAVAAVLVTRRICRTGAQLSRWRLFRSHRTGVSALCSSAFANPERDMGVSLSTPVDTARSNSASYDCR